MIERILAAGPRGRLLSLLVLIGISVIAGICLPDLTVDRSDDRLISEENPDWQAFQRMQTAFGGEQSVVVYLHASDLWTEERLKELQLLTFALEDTPGITSVNSLLSATNIRDKGDYVDAGPLATIVPKDPEKIAALRDDALYSPIMRRNVISDDGLSTVISLSYESNPEDPAHDLHVFEKIERHLSPLRANFDTVFQVGRPRLNYEIDRGLKRDLTQLIPAAFVVLVLVIVYFLRSLRVLPIPVVTSALTILWTFGFMALANIPVTLLTAMLPALIVVVGAVEDVHMLASYCEGLHADDADPRTSGVRHMARQLALPLFITGLTTAIGFIANIITDIPLIYEFAIASGFAMLANFVVTILTVPLMLHWTGPRQTRIGFSDGMPKGVIGVVVRGIEYLGEHGTTSVIVVTLGLLGWFGVYALDVKVNNDPLSYFPADHPLVRDAQTVHKKLSGLQGFSVTLESEHKDYFRTEEGLQKIASAQALLDKQGLFDKTLSLVSLLSLMHQEMHAGDKAFSKVPESRDDIDLYLSSLTSSDLEPFVTPDYRIARISVRHNVTDSVRLNAAVDELSTILSRVMGDDVDIAFTGKNLMINRTAESLIDGQITSLALILVVVFIIFSLLYTSVLAGLLALVPNLIPLILNFGTMGLLGVPLNPGTAMVAAIAIGIGVDDTIHLMTRFGTESRLHIDERDAVRATIRGEAVPVISSSVALALGFAVLGLSSFNVTAQFGLLAAATMVYAAVAELLITPIVLKHLRLATVWDIIALKLDRQVLVGCPLFRGMSEYDVRKIAVLSDIQEFSADEVVIKQGSISRGMYVILQGSADVDVENGGLVLNVDKINPGDLFGEIGFSGEGIERTATIVARTPLTVVRFDADSARKGLRFYPGIARQLHQNISVVLGRRLVDSHQRLISARRDVADHSSRTD